MPLLTKDEQRALLQELVTVVRKYSPEWTAANPNDPGATLLQLFSFLTETLLFRANQIPERNRRVLKQLLREITRLSPKNS